MASVAGLRIRNFRSIGPDGIEIHFTPDSPLVILGENNAGKSNVVRALELVLGESWPGSYQPEPHDFHLRDTRNSPIEIYVDLRGVSREYRGIEQTVEYLVWRHEADPSRRTFWMKVFDEDEENPYVSNDIRDQAFCIVVGADRRLQYQLGYSSKFTLLSRLMRHFHAALTANPERMERLRETFARTREIFAEVEEFDSFTRVLGETLGELSGNMAYGLEVDFSAYDPANYFHALRVMPKEGGEMRAFDELGTGQEQVLALAVAYAYAQAFKASGGPFLLVIEEPEAHLHPLAQRWVSRIARRLAQAGVQVVLTTHSPTFVDVMGLPGTVALRKEGDSTSATQLSTGDLAASCRLHGAPAATDANILPFYATAATNDLLAGLFARRVVLVEGPTEALSLPIYLERGGLQTDREGIAVISVGGVGNIARWWRFYVAYGIATYVIFDNDASDDSTGDRRRDLLGTLDVPSEQWDAVMALTQVRPGRTACVMGNNWETSLREMFGAEYQALEEEAVRFVGSSRLSKPLVARYIAERIEVAPRSAADLFFTELAERIMAAQ